MIGKKLAYNEERKSVHNYFTISRSEVSTKENLVVIRRRFISGGEKAKLVNIHFSCLMKNLDCDSSIEGFGAADVVKATQRLSIAR